MNEPCSPPSRFRLVSRLSRLLPPVESGTSAPLRWVIDVPHLHRAERLAFSSINVAQAKLRVLARHRSRRHTAQDHPRILLAGTRPAWMGYSAPTGLRHAQLFGQCHV